MTLSEITEIIWHNVDVFDFGAEPGWSAGAFMNPWIRARVTSRPKGAGWYWIETDADIASIPRPTGLPAKGCDFSPTAEENQRIFPMEMRTKVNAANLRIVYNGHENKVISRVRAHFILNSSTTGALGIYHYPLSSYIWRCYYFTSGNIGRIGNAATRQIITDLLNNKTGRTAIEATWRVLYGWPELCKE